MWQRTGKRSFKTMVMIGFENIINEFQGFNCPTKLMIDGIVVSSTKQRES